MAHSTLTAHPGFRIGLRPVSAIHMLVLALRAYRVSRQRRQLAEMSDRQLKDIGITRAEANAEARRSFWDLPEQQFRGR